MARTKQQELKARMDQARLDVRRSGLIVYLEQTASEQLQLEAKSRQQQRQLATQAQIIERLTAEDTRNALNLIVRDFARRVAKAMLELGSSHVYFIVQKAYGKRGERMSWEEVAKLFESIIHHTETEQ